MKPALHLRLLSHISWGISVLLMIAPGSSCAIGGEGARIRPAQGDPQRIQPSLVSSLFEDDVLADNVIAVRRTARQMSAGARYKYLQEWVLPSGSHFHFRLAGKQTPADPVRLMIEDHPFDVERQLAGAKRGQRRIHTGGNWVSPAYDLIETAKELGKLDELRSAVQASSVRGEVQERCRFSMLAMIDMARGDAEAAQLAADQLYNRFLNQRFPQLADRMPETLFTCMAAEKGLLTNDALRFLSSIVDSQIRAQKFNGPYEWDRLIAALMGRIRYQELPESAQTQAFTAAPDLKSWYRATRIHSWGSGSGIPAGHMQLSEGSIETLANMDDEYLYFTSPLRGNYTLECDCTGFGWKEIFPFVAGSWISVAHNHDAVQLGELYKVVGSVPVDPKLSRVDDWIHFRVDVRDGECFRFINSRLVSRESLPKEHDPWVAMRNPGGGNGSIRNLRITGNPVIPDQVTISEFRTSSWRTDSAVSQTSQPVTHLHSWMPWIEDPWYPEKLTWQLEEDPSGATQIVGHRRPELAGTAAERLLRYHWPIVWNTRITYEFFYSGGGGGGESIVHPAIGRRALLLSKDDVRTHWITNGIWDSTTLDPLNANNDDNRELAAPLPFKEDAWNELTLSLSGDELAVSLNGTTIFEGELEATNDRTFGLFYYCDQSEARVRNIVLKGDWPKVLPPMSQQELRGTETENLDRERDALAESFDFNFIAATEEEFRARFMIANSRTRPMDEITLQPDGLHIETETLPRKSATAYVSPRLTISGDFDVIAEFDALNLAASDNGVSAIYLGPTFRDKTAQSCFIFRGIVQHPDNPLRELTQVEFLENSPKGFKYSYPAIKADECRSGRLRIARRGTKLSFLIAPLDSEKFQLLHTGEVSDVPLMPGTLMLRNMCYCAGSTGGAVSVVWKKISLRAEAVSEAPIPETQSVRNLYLLSVPDIDSLRKSDVPLWKTYCQHRADQFQIFASDVKRLDDPILVHRQGDLGYGLVHLWTQANGRPAAIGTILLLKNVDTDTYREFDEFHSLHSSPLTMIENGRVKWTVSTPGLEWRELEKAPEPAASADALCSQAKFLTQRFSSVIGGPDRRESALMESPIYKYTFEENGRRLAGTLNAFGPESNPELLLCLEVRPNSEGQFRWHFAAASYTDLAAFLFLDGQTVWREAKARFGANYRHFGFFHRQQLQLEDGLAEVLPGDVRQIAAPSGQFTELRLPEWSENGEQVAYEMSSRTAEPSQLQITNSDGKETRHIGPGSAPCFSPDGNQIVFSQLRRGILTTRPGTWTGIPMESKGWGAQWSPDGQSIAWISDNRIVVLSTTTQKRRSLLNDRLAAEYTLIENGLGWAHDSKSLAFRALRKSSKEDVVAIVDMDSPDQCQIVYSGKNINPDLSWHPDGKRILFSVLDSSTKTNRLFTVHRDAPDALHLLPGQPPGWRIFDCDWSPDGRKVVFTAEVPSGTQQRLQE